MNIIFNGTPRQVPDRITIAVLVREVGAGHTDGRGMAVAVDAAVVPRSEWDEVELSDGQRVEVVGAIQGG